MKNWGAEKICKFQAYHFIVLGFICIVAAFFNPANAMTEIPEGAFVRVTDLTNTLTQDQKANLMRMSNELDTKHHAVVLTLIVPTIGEESIEQFSMRVAEKWTPGHVDDKRGAILVIAKNDKKFRIEVSRQLGTTLTDAKSRQVLDSMKPFLKTGNLYGAVEAFYKNVEPSLAKEPVAASVPVEEPIESDNTGVYILALFGLAFAGIGIAFWLHNIKVEAKRKADEELRRLDREAQARRRREAEELEARIKREAERRAARDFDSRLYSNSTAAAGIVGSAIGAGAAAHVASQSRNTVKTTTPPPKPRAAYTPPPTTTPAPKRSSRSSDSDDDLGSLFSAVAAAAVSSYSSDDDSRRSSSSSSSSFSSSSDSSSYDGGGSSSSWD